MKNTGKRKWQGYPDAEVLARVRVRLIEPRELKRWNELVEPAPLFERELNRKGLKQLARKNLSERYQPFETDYRLCPELSNAPR